MTAPQEDELGPKPSDVYHDPGKPEDYAGQPTDDGWHDDPVERRKGMVEDGKLDPGAVSGQSAARVHDPGPKPGHVQRR